MRKILVLFLGMLLSALANAQTNDSLLSRIIQSMQMYESNYRCKDTTIITPGDTTKLKANAISDGAFKTLYSNASNRILGLSDDFIKNGKGATLEFNEALKKITINHSWKSKKWDNYINNFGFTGEEASKKFFEFFGKKGWKDGFQFSFGGAISLKSKRKLYFFPDGCDDLKKKRERYYSDLLSEYEITLNIDDEYLSSLKARDSLYKSTSIFRLPSQSNFVTKLTEEEEKVLRLRDTLESLKSSGSLEKYKTLYEDSIAKFEERNFKDYGYSVSWLNWGITGGLVRFSTFDTTVSRIVDLKKKHLPRYTINVSYNLFAEFANKTIFYFSVLGTGGNTNFLDELLPSEITEIKSQNQQGTSFVKEDYDALIIQDYDRLKSQYIYTSLSLVLSAYPGNWFSKARFLGFEGGASIRTKHLVPENVAARDLINLHAGLLFTFEKDKIAKTTIALLARVTDMPTKGTSAKDYFNVGLRIGVPFNY
jgi:hypothetical protein